MNHSPTGHNLFSPGWLDCCTKAAWAHGRKTCHARGGSPPGPREAAPFLGCCYSSHVQRPRHPRPRWHLRLPLLWPERERERIVLDILAGMVQCGKYCLCPESNNSPWISHCRSVQGNNRVFSVLLVQLPAPPPCTISTGTWQLAFSASEYSKGNDGTFF